MKGFAVTLSTLLILSVLFSLALSFFMQNDRFEGALSRAHAQPPENYVFDDIAEDLSSLASANISANRSSSALQVRVQGSFADAPNATLYSSYASFLKQNYSNATNSNYSIDVSALADSAAEANFSNGLFYAYTYTPASTTRFSSTAGNTSASDYSIRVFVNAKRTSYTAWSSSPTPDMNVSLSITDQTGTITSLNSLDGSLVNNYTIAYQGGNVIIRVGAVGAANSLEINPSGMVVPLTSYAFNASMPAGNLSQPIKYYWNARLNHSQLNSSRSDFAEIGRA